ncbi:prepilin-type N-terminal cleavage/methylation domain-containing protein [Sharpea porci]|uniref:prepilin-type N-terminal cleavage/methylation domain-containing protein n=1 Tax=Sharpea porci TaxID=2652286 RepID=UPI002A9204DD|nr:prepilin-type N-terminal cleavage/methylation domain-containing protein [Sharpea porci]MDY5278988.1 prepilin-type N-terminal cleavage/methylation domain-containing protein [Sharpea porci]
MMKMLKKNKGFTLIEIIVVIVILAVLMAVAVPSVMSYMNEGKKAKYESVARGAMVNAQVQLAKAAADDTPNYGSALASAVAETNADSGNLEVDTITTSNELITEGDGATPTKDTGIKTYIVKFKDNTKAYVNVNKKVTIVYSK